MGPPDWVSCSLIQRRLRADYHSRNCQAVLQGHTSLVGQLQMRGNTLVTGGSDGSVRVWSLERNACVHRLAAHDNSVTSLQFDDTRIVSGGSDGRVKVWDLRTGLLVRELSSPAQAVWRVAFEDEKAVILASRADRTIMEVCIYIERIVYFNPLIRWSGILFLSTSGGVERVLPFHIHPYIGAVFCRIRAGTRHRHGRRHSVLWDHGTMTPVTKCAFLSLILAPLLD